MKAASIAIFSGTHLCINPRVIKEATTLMDAGYQVEVIGAWFDETLKARDQQLLSETKINYRPVLDLVKNSGWLRFAMRLKRKAAEIAHAKVGFENVWQLSYFSSALRRAACQSQADLLIAHSEPTMAAVITGHRRRQKRIGLDLEDWFSEDRSSSSEDNRPRRYLRSLEQFMLNEGSHSSCASRVMSQTIADEFGCLPPPVVYNAFPWADRLRIDGQIKDRRQLSLPSIHWYSQTLGLGRGLEDLFQALPYLEHEAEIHLRGRATGDFENWLTSQVSNEWRNRIFIHDQVPNGELLSRIAEHDIGFAGEMKFCRNKDLAVSNKLLQYLLAGLAVVASDTSGQREVAREANGAMILYKSGDPLSLAGELNALLAESERLEQAKAAALSAAERSFCWEKQAPMLLSSIEQALKATGI